MSTESKKNLDIEQTSVPDDALQASGLDQIGRRLHAMRRAQGTTLEELASDCGLSTGYLSQIENGTAIPSITALQLIAAELGVDVTAFFPDERQRGTRVIRASDRHEFRIDPGSGEEYAVLAGQVHNRAFSALYARHQRSDRNERAFGHLGEEFGLVLKGRLRLVIDGEAHELGPGDWIHYSSHPTHSGQTISDEPAETLWLLTPAVV
jgi:transcriptional regulator with XRE-family HTH domain